ncbi:MAG: ArsR family transcriptional regulator [Nanoarchaeota archaeon]|jgi:uncharacterized membrane protein|nr:ArsR family transcriptional regulator [Nanoarchaeota archaeon]
MKKVVLFLILFCIPLVFAGSFEYQIIDNKVLTYIIIEGTGAMVIDLPTDFTALDVSTNYFMENRFLGIVSKDEIEIKYITKSLIEKTGNEFFFISKNDLHVGQSAKVLLPEGAVLMDKYITFPKDYNIETNGKNIILSWEELTEKEILVAYKIPTQVNWILYIVTFIFLCASAYFYYSKIQSIKKSKTKNLYGEEKDIMKFLIEKKECWTKEIVKELGISKVKLSRRLRDLEEKGLITREPHGNENRIKLKIV